MMVTDEPLMSLGRRVYLTFVTFIKGCHEVGGISALPLKEASKTRLPVAARFLRVATPRGTHRARAAVPTTLVLFFCRRGCYDVSSISPRGDPGPPSLATSADLPRARRGRDEEAVDGPRKVPRRGGSPSGAVVGEATSSSGSSCSRRCGRTTTDAAASPPLTRAQLLASLVRSARPARDRDARGRPQRIGNPVDEGNKHGARADAQCSSRRGASDLDAPGLPADRCTPPCGIGINSERAASPRSGVHGAAAAAIIRGQVAPGARNVTVADIATAVDPRPVLPHVPAVAGQSPGLSAADQTDGAVDQGEQRHVLRRRLRGKQPPPFIASLPAADHVRPAPAPARLGEASTGRPPG